MSNYEATRYDFDGANLTDVQGVNTGIIVPWSIASVPSGFLNCDGAAVSRTTYAALFAVIGTNYGVGDGSTTFNVPDLTDRAAVGKSPTKAQFSTGGANAVTSTGNIGGSSGNTTLTTPVIASHTHPITYNSNALGAPNVSEGGSPASQGYRYPGGFGIGNAGGGGAHSHPVTGTFVGGSDSVLQPYLTIKYIIKT